MRNGWSLVKEDWKRLVVRVAGTNWGHVSLDPLYRDTVPDSAGVYMICASTRITNQLVFSRLYEVVYAGQEGASLRRRFLEHCNRPKEEIKKACDCLRPPLDYWFTTAPLGELDGLEGAVIDCFGPPANLVRKLTIKARLGPAEPA